MSQSDRELLELAAKAAGLKLKFRALTNMPGCAESCFSVDAKGATERWNPLERDGDAFRLAVQLAMFNGAMMFHFRSLERFGNPQASELECTRRAIVRTAADVGSSMP